jgi:hypothetical protein
VEEEEHKGKQVKTEAGWILKILMRESADR